MHHPIGQGLFASGAVRIQHRRFNYLYDCGTRSAGGADVVDRYVASLGDTAIDAIFISHLDADHVSQLQHLLAHVQCRRIYLPHMEPLERLLTLVRAINDGEILGVQEGYFVAGRQGVADALGVPVGTVTEVVPTGPDGLSDFVDDDLIDDRSPSESRADDNAGQMVPLIPAESPGAGSPSNVHPHEVSLNALDESGQPFLEFRTFVDPLIASVRADFAAALLRRPAIARAVGGADLDSWLRQTSNRKRLVSDLQSDLREAFRSGAGTMNRTTLSLFVGPLGDDEVISCLIDGTRVPYEHNASPAWLGTGDAPFQRQDTFRSLSDHLHGHRLAAIGTVIAPHHGASDGISPENARALGAERSIYSFGGRNTYGHPTSASILSFVAADTEIVCVTEVRASLHWEHYYVCPRTP